MNIGVDIRCLMHPVKTGVGEYTEALLNALFVLDKTNQYFLYYNSQKNIEKNLPRWTQDNVHIVASHYPNKILNAMIAITRYPKLDCLINRLAYTHLDAFYSPNLNFVSLTKDVKFFLTIHDISFAHFPEYFTVKQNWWHRIIRPKKQCQRAQIIFTPSENTKLDLAGTYQVSPEKIKVIYPGLSPVFLKEDNLAIKKTQIRQKYSLPDHFILFLGTIEPRKNVEGLIMAFEKVFSQLPVPYYLIIAGARGWKDKVIYARANRSPYRDYIKFLGFIPAEEKPALYALADLFVYPSFYEGFGFPVLEAMSMNTPVITSRRSSLPEITANSAYLMDPNNTHSLAYGILDSIKNIALRDRLTARAKERAQKFSWPQAATQFLDALKSLSDFN